MTPKERDEKMDAHLMLFASLVKSAQANAGEQRNKRMTLAAEEAVQFAILALEIKEEAFLDAEIKKN